MCWHGSKHHYNLTHALGLESDHDSKYVICVLKLVQTHNLNALARKLLITLAVCVHGIRFKAAVRKLCRICGHYRTLVFSR